MSEEITQRFGTFREWDEHLAGCPGPRPDDTPVIAGQGAWPRRRATQEELLALIRRSEAEDAAEPGGD